MKKRNFLWKQKLIGVALAILTVAAIVVLDGDATIALFTAPFIILSLFSKEKLIDEKGDCFVIDDEGNYIEIEEDEEL